MYSAQVEHRFVGYMCYMCLKLARESFAGCRLLEKVVVRTYFVVDGCLEMLEAGHDMAGQEVVGHHLVGLFGLR